MITVKIDDREYKFDSLDDELASLDGKETNLLEDYLGGFENFGVKAGRTTVVTVWLALRQAGEPKSLEEIEAIPGLLFGNVVTADGQGEPESPAKDPGRPLAATNGNGGSDDGSFDSEASQLLSGSTGALA